MKTKRILRGLAALVAGIGILGSGALGDESNRRALVPLEPEQTQAEKVEGNKRVYTLAPGNYNTWVEEEGENGMQCTPIGKMRIEKPLILVEDDSNENAKNNSNHKDEVKYSMKTLNPDGSVHYNVKVFDKEGRFLREYQEPSNERIERAPVYHSTTPVIRNPDGSLDFYRPLGPNESLDDAMKRGPDQRFGPERDSNITPSSVVGTRYVYEFKGPVYIDEKGQIVSSNSPGARLVYPNGVNQYTKEIKPGDKVKRVESELGPSGANLIYYLERGK